MSSIVYTQKGVEKRQSTQKDFSDITGVRKVKNKTKDTLPLDGYKFIDLFAGIGGIRIPFDELGAKCVFTSEWDSKAQETYEANFGHKPQGDITKIREVDIPDHDILLAGFPCQPFSIMGEKNGFKDTRGTLFFEIERILKEKKPRVFLLENVKNITTHDSGKTFQIIKKTLEDLGYNIHTKILNALDYEVAQKRERVIIIGFLEKLNFIWPTSKERKNLLPNILENDKDVCKSLFASPEIAKKKKARLKITPPIPSIWHENKSGNVSPLHYSCALRAGASYNYLLVNGLRRPSARELLRIQGFPDTFKIVVSYTQLRKQTGNAVSVPVIQAVAKQISLVLIKKIK